jgi:hypothetical protein
MSADRVGLSIVTLSGWARPFPDSVLRLRGGIQVDDQPPTCPLEAE